MGLIERLRSLGSQDSVFGIAAAELARLNAENAALRADAERLRDFVQEFADEPCSYGDNCPPFVKLNHGRCDPCKARTAMTKEPTNG